MIIASDLQPGVVLRMDRQIYLVLEVESKAGAAKLGGVVKTKLRNVKTAHMWEPHFRPQERLEDVEVQRRPMQFLYAEGEQCTFMDPDSFEQVEISSALLGSFAGFLQPGMQLPVDFFEGEPISVSLPDVAEVQVKRTAPPVHAQQDTAWKEAVLENGMAIRVPLFIAPGETVRIEVKTGRYIERLRMDRKRSA